MYSGVEYPDPRLGAIAAGMAIGWLRFPAGTGSDTFDWTTGQTPQAWVNQFDTTSQYTTLLHALKVLSGKGGDHFDDAADLSRDVGSVGLIVCVNAYTDTAASADFLPRTPKPSASECSPGSSRTNRITSLDYLPTPRTMRTR